MYRAPWRAARPLVLDVRARACHCSPSELLSRPFISVSSSRKTDKTTSPINELLKIRDVIQKLNQSNRTSVKRKILETDGQSLKRLFLFLYDPHVRMNVTSAGVDKYIEKKMEAGHKFPQIQHDSLITLFRELDSRELTGNAAMERIGSFLQQVEREDEGMIGDDNNELSLREVFLRCLDRNLKAGINSSTINEVYRSRRKATEDLENDQGQDEMSDSSSPWSVALGKSCNSSELEQLFSSIVKEEGEESWYMSRKLDGVRCIVRVVFDIGEGIKVPLKVAHIETLSRTENAFTSLDLLKTELSDLLSECPCIVPLLEKSSKGGDKQIPLYLDGEVCALIPEQNSQDGFKEDFTEIVGAIRRQSYTVPNPAYFPFDILNESEFIGWQSEDAGRGFNEAFYSRRRRVDEFVNHCHARGSIIVRKLDQTRVTHFKQVEEAMEISSKEGWEGIIFRKGDKYVGKRTSSIRKFKQWQDAEYTVLDAENAIMRLPVDQKYEEREGLASVTIDHNGTKVSVGSGFTVEERLRYAADPSLILGKEITVQYFGESSSLDRSDKSRLSLRFPRVRKVWEEGKRSV